MTNSVELFTELLSRSQTYLEQVLASVDLAKGEIDFSIWGYYREERFLEPSYLVFERPGFILAKSLSRRTKLIYETLQHLAPILNKLQYEGSVLLNLSKPSLLLDEPTPQLNLATRLFTTLIYGDLGPRLKGRKGWICVPLTKHGVFIDNDIGEGASPSIARLNAGLAPECSSVYLKLRKGGLV